MTFCPHYKRMGLSLENQGVFEIEIATIARKYLKKKNVLINTRKDALGNHKT